MKIVVIGKSQEIVYLFELLQSLKFSNLLHYGNSKYEIRADDCVIFDDAMREMGEIQNLYSLKFREQQPLKLWSMSEFQGEVEKFGYHRLDGENERLSQIFSFLFTGKKLPYKMIKR